MGVPTSSLSRGLLFPTDLSPRQDFHGLSLPSPTGSSLCSSNEHQSRCSGLLRPGAAHSCPFGETLCSVLSTLTSVYHDCCKAGAAQQGRS